MSQVDQTKLLQDIENAFSNTTYPGDDNLVYDNSDTYTDVVKTKRDFLGKHWKEYTPEPINYRGISLPFLTAEAFCFYLPVFLIASISYPIQIIDVFPENLISNLAPDENSEWHNNKLRAIANILSSEQRRVVIGFLDWYTHKYILDFPDYPEDLKDLKRFHVSLWRATNFWKDMA